MKNIRLYIGGVRADLDSSVTIPFNYQTTDAESPTAVKNSYSKTVTLQGTETNRRLFGGLWHLDSLVRDWQPAPPPRFVAEASESDAEFTFRATPAVAVGDTLKAARILGRTIVWNQLVQSDTTYLTGENGITATISGGWITLNGTASADGMVKWILLDACFAESFIVGHKYFFRICPSGGGSTRFWGRDSNSKFTAVSGNAFDYGEGIIYNCANTNGVYFSFYFKSGISFSNTKFKPICIDLTQMFGSGNEPTTLSAFTNLYYGLDYAYDSGSLQSNRAAAIETTGFNQWDEEWELGTYNITTGAKQADSSRLRNKNYIPVLPSTNYYIALPYNAGTYGIYLFFYDKGKNFLSYALRYSHNIPVPAGAYYLNFSTQPVYGTTYHNNICINLSDTSKNGTYEPYHKDTLTLNLTSLTSGGVAVCPEGLKAADYAGTICDETDGQVLKNRVKRVNLGDLSWTYGSGIFRGSGLEGIVKEPATATDMPNAICAKYTTRDYVTAVNTDKSVTIVYSTSTYHGRVYITDSAYSDADVFKTAMNGVYVDVELATPVDYVLDTPIDTLCPFELGGTQLRLPEDTAADVQAPFRADFEYGRMIPYPEDEGVYFNPMKRVGFLLYVDEMIVERGYCQLTAINRKGRDYTFSVSLFGGLGEFFYNLQTDADGESRTLADLDWGADLGFRINGSYVQNNWDDLLGGTLPTIAFVPMHNGVPSNIDADKALISGGGVPGSIVDGGTTYSDKNGYLLASLERKYTEWEIGDLRSYLQRPALRLKDFIAACCASVNNGGWTVDLDSEFFTNTNPYYEKTYILLPQLNVEGETEDICDDGSIDPASDYPSTVTRTTSLDLSSGGCLTIVSDYVDMSASASNAYLKVSAPVQLSLTGVANQGGPLFLTNRVSHHTENKTICMMLAAWDDDGNLIAVSNRYVFTSKSHRMETGDVKKPAAPYSTSDAQIDGYFAWDSDENRYIFRADDNPANTFALTIDKVQRPSSTLHQVRIDFILQMTAQGIPTLNKMRYGYNSFNVPVSNTNFKAAVLSGSNNNITLVEPTQYATDSEVTQKALLSSLKETPLDILLSITKRFGLMWVQDNREKKVSLYMRKNYYTGAVRDIHDRIDYSKGLKATPVAAESNNYVLEDEYPETTLSKAYESDWGRVYGAVRLKTGYDFGKDKVEMMDKLKLKGYVDGALSGAGYWKFVNSGGELPSAIAEGMKVTYYHESGGVTDTKDIDYNLFNVSSVQKFNSPALGVACMNDSGEEESKEVAPALVFFAGGQVPGIWHLTDDNSAMAQLNGGPCWIFDPSLATARVPQFSRVATFSGETYSLDYGTPRETYYIPEVSLAPEQAIYTRFWEDYLTDLLSRDTKKVEAYVVFPPHLDMRQEMRKFYLFDRSLWVLNKITDYDPTKEQSVKCEFIRVLNREAYRK